MIASPDNETGRKWKYKMNSSNSRASWSLLAFDGGSWDTVIPSNIRLGGRVCNLCPPNWIPHDSCQTTTLTYYAFMSVLVMPPFSDTEVREISLI
jgi:hypothetical protein